MFGRKPKSMEVRTCQVCGERWTGKSASDVDRPYEIHGIFCNMGRKKQFEELTTQMEKMNFKYAEALKTMGIYDELEKVHDDLIARNKNFATSFYLINEEPELT